MSSGGQIVGGIIGAVIGFYVGGPVGALQGAALGAGIGGYLDPPKGPTVSGPRLTDLAVQTSTYGAHIPRVYGTVGIHGNILWLENNKLKESVRKEKQGGKGAGGGSTTVRTYSYSATFILGLCEGPIAGVKRIWCQDKLIYNAGSDDIDTIIASNSNALKWKVYLGDDDQAPDPRYQADVGVANASAFRGMAYIAFYDFELADYSNTLQAAQFKVEVVKLATAQTPQLVSAVPLLGNTELHRATAVYFSESGVASLFKRRAEGVIGRYKVSPSGNANYLGDVAISDTFLLQGWADVECVLDPETNGFAFLDKNGVVLSRWTLSFAYWHYIWVYRLNDIEFVIQQYGDLPADTSRIYKKDSSVIETVPTLISETNTSSPYGRIFDIFPAGDYIYALTWTRQVLCMDTEANVIWAQDLSSQTQISIGAIGSDVARLRTDDASCIYIRSRGKFWVVREGGFAYLGDCGLSIAQYYATGGDSVVGGVWFCYSSEQDTMYTVNINPSSTQLQQLAEVIEDEVSLSSMLLVGDLDTSLVNKEVRGYRVQGGSIRSALEPLQAVFPFDVIQAGYKVKFVPRGQASVAQISHLDLVNGGDSNASIKQGREMDSQLPVRTNVKYLDAVREYAISEQQAERINTKAINRVDRELPLVLTADEAAGVAEVLQFLPWLERTEISITLPPDYLDLEVSDCITLITDDFSSELRLTEIGYRSDGSMECKAKPNRAAIYTSGASGSEGVAPDGTIDLGGETEYAILDIPVVDEAIQDDAGITLAMTGVMGGWPGAVLFRSSDEGQTWTDLQAIIGKCTFGNALGTIPARAGTLIDRGSSLVVYLISGTLESITEAQMLNGRNYAAYGAAGRWEIIRFQNATLNADGSYTLDTFIRGDKGTEQYTGTHLAGDTFVLLDDPDNAFVDFPSALIGVPQDYRAITAGASIDSDSSQTYTYTGVNLKCLSGVHAKGRRNTGLDLTITWVRRTRVGGEWRDSVDASLGEATEAYEVDILNGSTVVRTISATTPSVTYTAAQQTTDFGSTQASVLVRIYQLSSVIGRGYPLEATL